MNYLKTKQDLEQNYNDVMDAWKRMVEMKAGGIEPIVQYKAGYAERETYELRFTIDERELEVKISFSPIRDYKFVDLTLEAYTDEDIEKVVKKYEKIKSHIDALYHIGKDGG